MSILPIPIASCKRFAKCGERSLHWCRAFRDKEKHCQNCTLIKNHVRHNVREENGVTLRRCSVCGKFLPLRLFYPKKIIRGNKIYYTYSSYCRICTSNRYRMMKMA